MPDTPQLINPLTNQPINDSDLATLSALVNEQVELEREIEDQEAELKARKEELKVLSTIKIPAKMDELGMTMLKTTDGHKVEIRPFYSCKIISPSAFSWLDEHGHGGIIKTKIVREYLRTDRDAAVEYQKAHPEFKLDESIHHQTMGAFVKEMYSKNEFLPEDLFAVYQGSITKIS